jgi:hypothetical protein
LTIATKYGARFLSIPTETAWETKYAMGINDPNENRIFPKDVSEKAILLKGIKYSLTENGLGFRGILDLTARLVVASTTKISSAVARMAQGKPIVLIKRLTMIGKINPPVLEPVATIPKAVERRLSK